MTDIRTENSKTVLGEYLTGLREAANLTKKELAERIGVNPTTVLYWETGDRLANLGSLQSLARLLGGDFDYITALYHIAQGVEDVVVPTPRPQEIPDEFLQNEDWDEEG